MKKLLFIVLTCLALDSAAQGLTKAEKKALKQEIKNYKKSPESYKAMKDKNTAQIADLEKVIEDLSNQLAEARKEQNNLNDSLKACHQMVNECIEREENRGQVPMGTVYQVQIGFYEKLDLKSFNREGIMVKAEETGNSKRYVIGHFANLDDAKRFNRDIQKLGVKDSFVSKYDDGVRDMTFDAEKVK